MGCTLMDGKGTEHDKNEGDNMRTICQIFAKRDHGNGAQLSRMQRDIATWINEKVVLKGGRITHVVQSLASEKGFPLVVVTILAEVP